MVNSGHEEDTTQNTILTGHIFRTIGEQHLAVVHVMDY